MALLLVPMLLGVGRAAEAPESFPQPPELEADVRFWIRVYTEVTTDQGLLHDDWDLGLVYEVLRFDPADSPRQRERIVAQAKARYAELLRRFASGATDNFYALAKSLGVTMRIDVLRTATQQLMTTAAQTETYSNQFRMAIYDFGVTADEVRARFKFYFDAFPQVKAEVD